MIRLALEKDLDLIIYFINKIAEYEKMSDDVVLDKKTLRKFNSIVKE